MGALSPWHFAILAVVMIALFGAKRLPDTARGVGQSLKILKSELSGGDSSAKAADASGAALPGHTAPVATAQPAEQAQSGPTTPTTRS